MVNVVDYLVEHGSLLGEEKIEAPRNIRQMIERNLQRLTPDDRRVLEACSVAGIEFSATAVAAALERPLAEIDACCTHLARGQQFVDATSVANWPDGTVAPGFRFHHALYQETLYEGMPASHRVEFHQRIAARMESAFEGLTGEIAAELANHFRRSGNNPQALKYLELAGNRASDRRAYREAEQYYREAFVALQALPASVERDALELNLQLALGGVLELTQGWSASTVNDAYARARFLAEQSGGAKSFEIFSGLWGAAHTRGEQRTALALADQLLEIAHGVDTAAVLARAHYAQALPRYRLGDLTGARPHFADALQSYRAKGWVGTSISDARQGIVATLLFAGENEWHLGYADAALRYVNDAIASARSDKNASAIAFALAVGSSTYSRCGDFPRVLEASDEALRLSTESGFPQIISLARIWNFWARARLTRNAGSVKEIQETLFQFDAQKVYLARAAFLIALAETQAVVGAIDDAVATADQASRTNPENEPLYRPLALRVRGELRLLSGAGSNAKVASAESDFREAIVLAQRMGAKSHELRATTSLARLLRDSGRRDEARTMLAEIYGWFTEGFDTADLKDANALLDQLKD
jgi:tetratricopeptide (TPR) repeat protein